MELKNKKPLLIAIGALVVLAAVVLVLVLGFHIVDWKLYPKNRDTLDLREKEISLTHYDRLREKMPDTTILWNVPFQDGVLPEDTGEVTVTTLTEMDIRALTYLPQLQTVNAMDCRDYDAIMHLKQTLPQVQVNYQLLIAGNYYDQDTTQVTVDSITTEEVLSLQYLPKLEGVTACGGESQTDYSQLRNFCLNTGVEFSIQIGKSVVDYEAVELTLEAVSDTDIYLLQFVRNWTTLHLVNPTASADKLVALREQYPDAEITWELEFAGVTYDDAVTEVDLSQVVIEDLTQVEQMMAYFPNVQKVILGLCGTDNPEWGNSRMDGKLAVCPIDNETVAAYRDRVQDRYKVVWTVRLGPSIALRTDKDNFMPNHFGVGILTDEYSYNLRYCTDMVCLDLGHMTITQIEFVSFMPKLKYLILAWTNVKYIEPIRTCKELIFLELDNSAIRDISPLVDCTALEDLNIGNTWPDVEPLFSMPWLKNVYMIFGSKGDAWKVSQALPDTRVVTNGNATVGGNWRRMQNYYDMRDMLNAPYMN